MARGVNRVTLIGNLGADPETRHTAGGNAVTNIRIAVSESWKDKHTGEQQERTEWVRIVMFGKLSEIAGEFLGKGSKVYIEGRLQTRKFQGQDGQDRWVTEVIASQMVMLDSRGAQNSDSPPADYERPASGSGEGFDEDIPFSQEGA